MVAGAAVFHDAASVHTSLWLAATVMSQAYLAVLHYGDVANVMVAVTGLVVGNFTIQGYYAVGLLGLKYRLTDHGQILSTNDIAVDMPGGGALSSISA